ncbi:hypothetical protein Esti_005163 [Eimeria stiedai]
MKSEEIITLIFVILITPSICYKLRQLEAKGQRVSMSFSPSNPVTSVPSPPVSNTELTSAGVLPFTRLGGSRWCALLYNATGGTKAKCLTDFGGRREYVLPCGCLAPPPPPSGLRPASHTLERPDACAARELFEESSALWGLGQFLQPPVKPKPRAAAPVYQYSSSGENKGKRGQKARPKQENNAAADDSNHVSIRHNADAANTCNPMENLLSACEELGVMERDRYKCSIRHVPVLPCSLFCNLRGEEGAGAERNRRFILLDTSASRFLAPIHDTPPTVQNTKHAVYPPLHIRLHAVTRPTLFEHLLEKEKGEKRQKEENCGEENVTTEDQTRFAKEKLKGKNVSEKELGDAVNALSLSPSAMHTAQTAPNPNLPFSLETLLPTRHQVLSHPSFLREYLRNHTSGLMRRCRANADQAEKNDFAGSSEAAAALVQSALWRQSSRIALLDCPAAAVLRDAAEAAANSGKKTFVEIGREEAVTTKGTTGEEAVDLVVMGAACVSPYGFLIESDEEVAAKLKTFLQSASGYPGHAVPLAVLAHDLQVMEDLMPACAIPTTPPLSRGIQEESLLPPLLEQFSRVALEVNRLVAQSPAVKRVNELLKNKGRLRLISTPSRTLLCDYLFPTVSEHITQIQKAERHEIQ